MCNIAGHERAIHNSPGVPDLKLILPPGVSAGRFRQALDAFAAVVGREWVLDTDEDRDTYLDAYAPGLEESHAAAAAVAPADVAQIQAVLKVANRYRIPLWPISRGKNFGYGGAAPRMPGTVMLDLGRLNRIIEVNEQFGYCIVEPGVGFFDLHDHVQKNDIPLQLGIPGNGWGSVIGNALERGFSTAIGDHSNNICGLELRAPRRRDRAHRHGRDGRRQGLAAVQARLRPVLGPADRAVEFRDRHEDVPVAEARRTRLAINIDVKLDQPGELEWYTQAVYAAAAARRASSGLARITSHLASATMPTLRREWYTGRDSIPDEVIDRIKARFNVGWWNGNLRLAGYSEVCEANLQDRAGAAREVHAAGVSGHAHLRRAARRPEHLPAAAGELVRGAWRTHRLLARDARRWPAGAGAVRAHAPPLHRVRPRLLGHLLQRRPQPART